MKLPSLRHNWALKLVSIVLGVSIWLYVKGTEEVKVSNSFTLPLQHSSLAPNLEILDIPRTVSVTVSGPIEQIGQVDMNAAQKQLNAWVDLSTAQPGQGDYFVDLAIPQSLAKFDVTWERRVTVVTERIDKIERSVEVVPIGISATGLEFANASVQPERITLSGSPENLRKVQIVRVMLDIGKVRSGEAVELKPELLDAEQRPVANIDVIPEKVRVVPNLERTIPKQFVLVSPDLVGKPLDGYEVVSFRVEPLQVVVSGPGQVIQAMSFVKTKPIDLTGLSADGERTIELQLPPNVRQTAPGPVKVFLQIRPIRSRTEATPRTP